MSLNRLTPAAQGVSAPGRLHVLPARVCVLLLGTVLAIQFVVAAGAESTRRVAWKLPLTTVS